MWTGRVGVKSRFGWIGMRWNGLRRTHGASKILRVFVEPRTSLSISAHQTAIFRYFACERTHKHLMLCLCGISLSVTWSLHVREKEEGKVPVPASISAGKNECKRDWFLSRKNAARLCKTVFGGWEKDARPRKRHGHLLNDRQCWRISSVRD